MKKKFRIVKANINQTAKALGKLTVFFQEPVVCHLACTNNPWDDTDLIRAIGLLPLLAFFVPYIVLSMHFAYSTNCVNTKITNLKKGYALKLQVIDYQSEAN